jgi:hypothetical protein
MSVEMAWYSGARRRQILWLGVTAHPTAEWIAGARRRATWRELGAHHYIDSRAENPDNAHARKTLRR